MSNDNKEIFGEDNPFTSDSQLNDTNYTEEPVVGFTEDEPKEEYSSQFGELEEFLEDYDTVNEEAEATAINAKKGLSTKATAIIAVIAVLLVAIIALGAYFVFFNNSIKMGVWVPVTLDEATQEYVETDQDGVKQYYKFTNTHMIYCFGNEYASSCSESEIELADGSIVMKDGSSFTLNYEVTGNLIKGKYLTLVIAGYEDQPLTYKWKIAEKMPEHQGPDFTKNDEILGYWVYTNAYGENVYKEFTDDGVTNEYTAYQGTVKSYTQKYNFDGENVITLSPGGTDLYGAEIAPGSEDKNQAVIDGDTLTLYQYEMPYEFKKSSKEDYEKYRDAVLAGTYEYPTEDLSQYELSTEVVTTELTTEATTEATTEEVTEAVTE